MSPFPGSLLHLPTLPQPPSYHNPPPNLDNWRPASASGGAGSCPLRTQLELTLGTLVPQIPSLLEQSTQPAWAASPGCRMRRCPFVQSIFLQMSERDHYTPSSRSNFIIDCVLPPLFVEILVNGTNSLKWEKPIPQAEVSWMRRGLAVASFWTDRRNRFIFHCYAGAEPFSRKSTRKPRRAWEPREGSSLSRSPSRSDRDRYHQAQGSRSTAHAHAPPGKVGGARHGGKDWEGGQVPPSKWGGLSSGSVRTLGV